MCFDQVVQQLVEERMRVLQLTVFDQSLRELKERIDKIDCATKHQSALNTLQVRGNGTKTYKFSTSTAFFISSNTIVNPSH